MRLLLDTCTFLWMLSSSSQLSARAREAIVEPGNQIFLSAISAWEIARKYAQGSLALPANPSVLVPDVRQRAGVASIPLTELDALAAEKLPPHHKDPFDRMLIAQAIMNGLTIVTPDDHFNAYPVRVLW